MKKRVLVISTNRWPSPARISVALAKVGFQVAALSPSGSLIRKATAICRHYHYSRWRALRSIQYAIQDWSPELLICSDDRAVQDLHSLYARATTSGRNTDKFTANLIEASLGDPTGFVIARDKSKFMQVAQSLNVRCPTTTVLPITRIPESELERGPFPILLKADQSFGGRGVRIAKDKDSARSAFWELQFPTLYPSTLKRWFARFIIWVSPAWLPRPRRTVSLQERIVGRPANRALVCYQGSVLAGISVEAIETLSEFGPSTVVRIIDHAEMTATTDDIVKHLKLSGFIGFDFILDAADQAWLIEMNPRATPTSHLHSNTSNLSVALYSYLTGEIPTSHSCINHQHIALFPQELERSPFSEHLSHFYHDVPWSEPAFVLACLRHALKGQSSRGTRGLLGTRTRQASTSAMNIDDSHEGEIDLTIVIISFNTRDMTLECLRSVQAETRDVSYEIIVVDNNSWDGSSSSISAQFSDVQLIALGQNIGFAPANILAIKAGRGRRVLLLNPDTVVLDRAIDRLVEFANQNPSHRIWGGRTLNGDRSLNPSSCWRRMTLWGLICSTFGLSHAIPNSSIFNPDAYGGWDRGSDKEVDIVSGCFFLIDRKLWDQLGGFDPAFFMYGEEADLCLRASRVGARPIVTSRATIVHYGGASTASTLEQRILLFKGKTTLMNRHWRPVSRQLGKALFLLGTLIRWWAYWLASRLINRPDLKPIFAEWKAMWQRRKEWINGYNAVDNS